LLECSKKLSMKKIHLSGRAGAGKFALVDDESFEYLNRFHWCLLGAGGYAVRGVKKNRRCKIILMHREVFAPKAREEVDHVDGNPLNNCRSNLRSASHKQNSQNGKAHIDGSSKYKGVYWHKRLRKWHAQIRAGNQRIHLGYYSNEKDAAQSYDKAAQKLFGEFANPNFPRVMGL
jgi:hypothetical protein